MHIGMVGPIDTSNITHLLDGDTTSLPRGYYGAPLMGTLITELIRRGHRVSAFTISADMPLKKNASLSVTGKNFSMTYCPMRPRAWRPNGSLPGRIIDLYRFERDVLQEEISKAAPEVVHAHWAYEFALAALGTKIPHVITCHDSPYAIARMNSRRKLTISAYRWLRVLMARKVLREATCVTAVSPYMRDAVQSITKAKILVVPNPVDQRAFSLARSRTAPSIPRLVMVCNGWDQRKNPEPALFAFDAFRKTQPLAEMHLYGNDFEPGGRAEKWCTHRSMQAGITFHGSVRHEQLLREIAQFDLLIHPSLEESFGMVIAEAMAMGLPVVAGDASGAVPWVMSDAGALCDVRDTGAIAGAIRTLLVPEVYVRTSTRGLSCIGERFSVNRVADDYLAAYNRVLIERSNRKC